MTTQFANTISHRSITSFEFENLADLACAASPTSPAKFNRAVLDASTLRAEAFALGLNLLATYASDLEHQLLRGNAVGVATEAARVDGYLAAIGVFMVAD